MRIAYLDCFSGISGDMFLGALLDLGVPFDHLEGELRKLDVGAYHLHATRQARAGIEGVKFDVHPGATHGRGRHAHGEEAAHGHGEHHHHDHENDPPHHHPTHGHGHGHEHEPAHAHEHEAGRTFREIRELITRSALSDWVKQKAEAIFARVAAAEGKIHGQPPDQVHFHEVGGLDSIVDIVGACIAVQSLGCPRMLASAVVEGTGWVHCAHGRFPVPTPATLEILRARSVCLTQCDEPHELVTPTGAALLAELAESFGPISGLVIERVGYGLGTRDNLTRPNVLRVLLGEADSREPAAAHDWEHDRIVTLQTNLDDLNPEILGPFLEQALAAGALDAFHTAIQMKKNRPGVLLSVLCQPADADRLTELILRETSAFGVRRFTAERRKLRREIRRVQTAYGPVEVKLGWLDGVVVQVAPEFDSCKRLADESQVPLIQIYDAARAAGAPQQR